MYGTYRLLELQRMADALCGRCSVLQSQCVGVAVSWSYNVWDELQRSKYSLVSMTERRHVPNFVIGF